MNIASEYMFHLGKNGKLYTSVACDDDYYEFTEITADEFEKIRNEFKEVFRKLSKQIPQHLPK